MLKDISKTANEMSGKITLEWKDHTESQAPQVVKKTVYTSSTNDKQMIN
jgi:hypothetical protein